MSKEVKIVYRRCICTFGENHYCECQGGSEDDECDFVHDDGENRYVPSKTHNEDGVPVVGSSCIYYKVSDQHVMHRTVDKFKFDPAPSSFNAGMDFMNLRIGTKNYNPFDTIVDYLEFDGQVLIGEKEKAADKRFWVSGIIADEKPWEVHAQSCCLSMDEALRLVWKYHVNYGLLIGWIVDQNNNPLWTHSFINTLGFIESRKEEPTWLPGRKEGDANVIPVTE